jgi:hypothetical protein
MVRGKVKQESIDWFNVTFWVTAITFCLTLWGLATKGLFCLLSESL